MLAGINRSIYLITGRKPWSRGYGEHRQHELQRALAGSEFDAGHLPDSYGFRLDERIVEYPWLFSRMSAGPGRLLDAGSILNFDFALGHPKLSAKDVFISTLAPEPLCFWSRRVSYVFEDIRNTCFRDGYFDEIVCLSTLEHIGLDNTRYKGAHGEVDAGGGDFTDAVRQFARVLRPGGRIYMSFPFGRHKNHGWFQIFDAGMVDRVITAFGPSHVREYHFRYLPNGWVVSNREDSREATYFDIHQTRQYDSDFAAASRAVVCLEMTK